MPKKFSRILCANPWHFCYICDACSVEKNILCKLQKTVFFTAALYLHLSVMLLTAGRGLFSILQRCVSLFGLQILHQGLVCYLALLSSWFCRSTFEPWIVCQQFVISQEWATTYNQIHYDYIKITVEKGNWTNKSIAKVQLRTMKISEQCCKHLLLLT